MGYYTDGVTYFWFDDNQNFGGADPHVPGTPQNVAEFALAFPLVCGEPDFAGVFTKPGLVYFILQNTVIGGKAGVDPFNQTTWTELLSKYIFLAPGKTLTIRTQGAVPNVTLNHGIQIGSGKRASGSRGVNWYQGANLVIAQNANLYGGKYESDAAVQLSDSAANNSIRAAGCQFQGANSGVFGVQGAGVEIYNSLVGLSNNVTSLSLRDSDNLVVGVSGNPVYLVSSGSTLKKPKGIVLVGSPTAAHMRMSAGNPNWKMSRIKWANSTAPHLELSAPNLDPDSSTQGNYECEEFHFRVMDELGQPIVGIPARLVSNGPDYVGGFDPWFGGTFYSNEEGDYVWTDTVNTGEPNNLVARSWGKASGALIWRDRTFTLTINDPTFPGYLPAYKTRVKRFTPPGRDMLNGLPSSLGGDFYTVPTITVVVDFVTTPETPASPYTRKPVPATSFTPQGGPVTQFSPSDIPPTPFQRAVLVGTGYTPCGVPAAPTDFDRGVEPSTPFTRKPIPATTYVECGDEIPGKVILLVPGMVMRLSST